MRRTRMMLVAAVVAVSASAAGTGVALADTSGAAAADVPEECSTYSFWEWLFHHECHGHG